MREAVCPICCREIRYDASEREFCEWCGMGIEDPLMSPRFRIVDGRVLNFCCPNCLSVYLMHIKKVAFPD